MEQGGHQRDPVGHGDIDHRPRARGAGLQDAGQQADGSHQGPAGIVPDQIERRAGRVRAGFGPGPRILDLDLLLYGSLIEAPLKLPHADVLKYSFVLCPLAELAPSLVHPITGITVAESWQEMARTNPPLTNLGPLQAATTDGRQRLGMAEDG